VQDLVEPFLSVQQARVWPGRVVLLLGADADHHGQVVGVVMAAAAVLGLMLATPVGLRVVEMPAAIDAVLARFAADPAAVVESERLVSVHVAGRDRGRVDVRVALHGGQDAMRQGVAGEEQMVRTHGWFSGVIVEQRRSERGVGGEIGEGRVGCDKGDGRAKRRCRLMISRMHVDTSLIELK
jgi:hypothetical protein